MEISVVFRMPFRKEELLACSVQPYSDVMVSAFCSFLFIPSYVRGDDVEGGGRLTIYCCPSAFSYHCSIAFLETHFSVPSRAAPLPLCRPYVRCGKEKGGRNFALT